MVSTHEEFFEHPLYQCPVVTDVGDEDLLQTFLSVSSLVRVGFLSRVKRNFSESFIISPAVFFHGISHLLAGLCSIP